MDHFCYSGGELHVEALSAEHLAARFGTPCYIYSRAAIEQRYREFDAAFGSYPHRICYSVKANSNIALLNLLARNGSGFDIVSAGELERVLAAGGAASSVIFSGVGKSVAEIQRALEVGIGCFNIESRSELHVLNRLAGEAGARASIALRVNPDVDARTHPYIATGLHHTKFGIASGSILDLYREAAAMAHVNPVGIDCHIGSQITEIAPFVDACRIILQLVAELRAEGIVLTHLNMGGGLGIRYKEENPPPASAYASGLLDAVDGSGLELIFEPGRAIVAESGILLTRVSYLKENGEHRFAIVDAGMNDLIRPALYQAWQNVIPVRPREGTPRLYDVVGPVCESGDFLARERALTVVEGDLLAIEGAGAYGFSMSSNYNSRNRLPEILVDGDRAHLVRERETVAHQLALEHLLPDR